MAKKVANFNPSKAQRAAVVARETGKSAYAGGRVAQRMNAVRTLLGAGWPTGRIIDKLAEEFKCSERTVQTYLQAVREERRRDFEESARNGQLLGEVLTQIDSHYGQCMKVGDHAAAGKDIDRKIALGRLTPQRLEVSGPGGAPIQAVAAIVDKEALAALPDAVFAAMKAALKIE